MARHGTFLRISTTHAVTVTSAILVGLVGLVGCGSAPSTTDSGTGGGDGAAPASCGEPDRVCPAEVPFTGAPCEGALSCSYASYQASCGAAGAWSVEALCDGVPPGGGCVPPLAESCDAPFSGTLSGATVTIGPAGEDRAFTDGELVPVEHGAQGLSMIRWALHVGGVPVPPECVRARISFTYEGAPSPEVSQPMTLHCGASYATLNVLPDRPCEEREYALTMQVDVDGVGSASASLRLMGALCPREL